MWRFDFAFFEFPFDKIVKPIPDVNTGRYRRRYLIDMYIITIQYIISLYSRGIYNNYSYI